MWARPASLMRALPRSQRALATSTLVRPAPLVSRMLGLSRRVSQWGTHQFETHSTKLLRRLLLQTLLWSAVWMIQKWGALRARQAASLCWTPFNHRQHRHSQPKTVAVAQRVLNDPPKPVPLSALI